jgi:filamentous hemagglutinin
MGNAKNGDAKFAYVGTDLTGAITTIHTESGKVFGRR